MIIFQIVVNILLQFSIILLVGIQFSLIFSTAKYYAIHHSLIISFGGYFTYLFVKDTRFPFSLSIILSILTSIIIGFFIELLIFRKLEEKSNNTFKLIIASLGVYVILHNLISFFGGDDTKSIRVGEVKIGNKICGAYITDVQIVTIIVSCVLFIGTVLLLNKTKFGCQLRAVSDNKQLANIFGINSDKVILWAFGIGSGMAAIAGILVALDTNITPSMGFNLLLYGVIAMIIGGVGSTWGLVGGAFLLATAQHLGAYYIDSKWMEAIAYILLILFLIWRPLGFSGKKLKKTEI